MNTIKKNEFSILSYFLMLSLFWGYTVYSIFEVSGRDSWISMLLSFILSFIPVILYYFLLNHDPKLNIISLINKYFGKLGKVINLIFIVFILLISSMVLWNLTNFISSQYLYQTPRLVSSILFMILATYIVNKGLSTIGRTATILFILNILLFSLSAIPLISKLNLEEFFPILEFGMIKVYEGTYINVSCNILPLFTLLIIPKNNIQNNKKLISSFLKVFFISLITMFIVVTFTNIILGTKLASLYQYPEYHILKTINIANFFQRVESILSMQLIFAFTIAIVIYLYFLINAFKENFNIKKYNSIISIIFSSLILIISRIIFKDTTIAEYFVSNTYPLLSSIILFLIPLFILIVVKLRKI